MSGTGGARRTIQLDDAAVQAAFARLTALAIDLAPAMREVGRNLVELRRARFLRSQGPNRVPWKAKVPRKDGKNLPLVVSGRLRDSLAHRLEGNTLLIGSDLPYAGIHEFGGQIEQFAYSRKVAFRSAGGRSLFAQTRGKGKPKRVELRPVTFGARILQIPARPFLAADGEDRAEIEDIIARRIAAATGGARA